VCHSQRLNDTKLIPWLILEKSGDVLAPHCTCMASLGECCSHVGAVLFFLQYISLKKSESEKSVTDVSAYWVTPSKKNIEPKKISSIDFSHPKTIVHLHINQTLI